MQPTGSYPSKSREKQQNYPSTPKVRQIEIEIPLRVPDACNAAANFANLVQTFLESYQQVLFFKMSVQDI